MSMGQHRLPQHARIPEPELLFHPDRLDDRHFHPLEGLIKFGPYSRSLINHVLDPIRVAAVYPHGWRKRHLNLMEELESRVRPSERYAYLRQYPGFSRVFGLRLVDADEACFAELPSSLTRELSEADRPHIALAQQLSGTIRWLVRRRADFDVLLIYLPSAWSAAFFGSGDEDFNLHDYLKAITASQEIPSQIVTDWDSGALTYPNRASVLWRLGIALYTKAGGVPWRLADMDPGTAFIGLAYALRPKRPEQPRFVTCCSQVFDADGAGLEFLAYETDDVRLERKSPFLTRGEMRRVMSRSLNLFQRRHVGQTPERIVIHKTTHFTDEETAGCFEALDAIETVELLQVVQGFEWRAVRIEANMRNRKRKGLASRYPCERGTYVHFDDVSALVWSQGNVAEALGRNFFKEGKSIPRPLLVRRFAGHGGWEENCRHVLGLTKMDWNNDALYNELPVTLEYASRLAQIVKRMPELSPRPYQFRFFM